MKFLFCTEGRALSEEAIRVGGRVAKAMGAEATVLSVEPKPDYLHAILQHATAIQADLEEVFDRSSKVFQDYAEKGKKLLSELGVKAEVETLRGDPADEILAEAEKGYDFIVIGSRSKKGETVMLGSVSRKVVNKASLPVIVV
jgi:nucleotide-binding universal stress UspA family protein